MSEMWVELLVPLVAIPFGCGMIAFLGALLFPSTREAVAAWMHRKAAPDSLDASASAQLMALRNEVYALRCEVAAVARTLPPGDPSMARIGSG